MRPEEIEQGWPMTRGGRRFRQLVVDPLGHETYRTMIRETYPAQLERVGPGWLERWGAEVDWTATEVYAEARREGWARDRVAAAGKSWVTHMAKFSGAVLRRETPSDGANRMARTLEAALRDEAPGFSLPVAGGPPGFDARAPRPPVPGDE